MPSSDNMTYHKILALFIVVSSFSNKGTDSRVLGVHQEAAEDLLEYACKHTLYYAICKSSLLSDPRSKTSDLAGLAGVALDLSITQGRKVLSLIQKLKSEARSNGTRNAADCLDDCANQYLDALDNLNETIHALRAGYNDTVNQLVSGSETDSQTCEDGLEDGNYDNGSFVTDENQYFYKLCSNLLAITTLL